MCVCVCPGVTRSLFSNPQRATSFFTLRNWQPLSVSKATERGKWLPFTSPSLSLGVKRFQPFTHLTLEWARWQSALRHPLRVQGLVQKFNRPSCRLHQVLSSSKCHCSDSLLSVPFCSVCLPATFYDQQGISIFLLTSDK